MPEGKGCLDWKQSKLHLDFAAQLTNYALMNAIATFSCFLFRVCPIAGY